MIAGLMSSAPLVAMDYTAMTCLHGSCAWQNTWRRINNGLDFAAKSCLYIINVDLK